MKKYIIISIALVLMLLSSGCIETGTGVSVDSIAGIEYDGLVWKTYSVYLTNDHPSTGTHATNSYSAIYTVNSNDVNTINLLKEASSNRKSVKVYYKNMLFYEPWLYTSDAIALIYKVEYV